MTRPNGIAISIDEKTLYVANSDSKNPVIMKYKITDEGVENPEVFLMVLNCLKRRLGCLMV